MSRLLGALANERRRTIVAALRESEEGAVSLSDLAMAIARRESGGGGTPAERDLEEVVVSLHHVHLPTLHGSGLVEYDAQSGCVRYRGSRNHDELVELAVGGIL